ncbi:hypothetical protein FRB90_007892 [Tulasnella sp. 427]|nr:hypothetical protein FRB90_007892 [Tulasnella sp. 427]
MRLAKIPQHALNALLSAIVAPNLSIFEVEYPEAETHSFLTNPEHDPLRQHLTSILPKAPDILISNDADLKIIKLRSPAYPDPERRGHWRDVEVGSSQQPLPLLVTIPAQDSIRALEHTFNILKSAGCGNLDGLKINLEVNGSWYTDLRYPSEKEGGGFTTALLDLVPNITSIHAANSWDTKAVLSHLGECRMMPNGSWGFSCPGLQKLVLTYGNQGVTQTDIDAFLKTRYGDGQSVQCGARLINRPPPLVQLFHPRKPPPFFWPLIPFHQPHLIEIITHDSARMPGPKTSGSQLRNLLGGLSTTKSGSPLVILQYDSSVTPWPIVRHLLWNKQSPQEHVICLAFKLTLEELVGQPFTSHNIMYLDQTGYVPGYTRDNGLDTLDPKRFLLDPIVRDLDRPLSVLIDSLETFRSDIGSISSACLFVSEILETLRKSPHHHSSQLILPIPSRSPLLSHLTSTLISQQLNMLILHSPYLVAHMSRSYLTPPPLDSAHPSDKFWSLFLPAAQRGEGEKLVLSGEGGAHRQMNEGVVEVVVRGGRKGVERTLEAWRAKETGDGKQFVEACLCGELEVIKATAPHASVKAAGSSAGTEAGVTHGLSFNLTLTSSQAEAKSKVALPYTMAAQQGEVVLTDSWPSCQLTDRPTAPAVIHYDPDSADDMDDEDPDEDLDL